MYYPKKTLHRSLQVSSKDPRGQTLHEKLQAAILEAEGCEAVHWSLDTPAFSFYRLGKLGVSKNQGPKIDPKY